MNNENDNIINEGLLFKNDEKDFKKGLFEKIKKFIRGKEFYKSFEDTIISKNCFSFKEVFKGGKIEPESWQSLDLVNANSIDDCIVSFSVTYDLSETEFNNFIIGKKR